MLCSFGGRVLVAVAQADPDSGNVTTGVGAPSIEGVFDWVVPMEVSGGSDEPLAPSQVFVGPGRSRRRSVLAQMIGRDLVGIVAKTAARHNEDKPCDRTRQCPTRNAPKPPHTDETQTSTR